MLCLVGYISYNGIILQCLVGYIPYNGIILLCLVGYILYNGIIFSQTLQAILCLMWKYTYMLYVH
jgi:hypothetical protein